LIFYKPLNINRNKVDKKPPGFPGAYSDEFHISKVVPQADGTATGSGSSRNCGVSGPAFFDGF
jgi:hypothetical protein